MNEPDWLGAVIVSETETDYTFKNLKEYVNGQKVGPETIDVPKTLASEILLNNHNYQRDCLISKEKSMENYPDNVWVSVREL
ncbi:hypothetical protein [Streptococcus parauberis]|uniref:hypothetical protein n=1 Tax=Streptococcus parauberis TaxID=1348 RepID=UPI0002F9ADC2|nr:hypothetical protein [Streptococcus parauberis]QBX17876.1 hypothetical protein Javan383_0031 [Streptococcus phage Javan383]UWM90197.1 hypothetical protein N2A94_06775 [Streptococcus parauberis]